MNGIRRRLEGDTSLESKISEGKRWRVWTATGARGCTMRPSVLEVHEAG